MNIVYNLQIKDIKGDLVDLFNLFENTLNCKVKINNNSLNFQSKSDNIKIIRSQTNSILEFASILNKTRDL